MSAVVAHTCGVPLDAESLVKMSLRTATTLQIRVVRGVGGQMEEFVLQRLRRSPRCAAGGADALIHCVAFDTMGGAQTQTQVLTLPAGTHRILRHHGADGGIQSIEVWPEASVEAYGVA